MLLFLYALPCSIEPTKTGENAGIVFVDNDGVGYCSDEDCNDLEANIYNNNRNM